MADESSETKIFKLWKCSICGDNFNHNVTVEESKKGIILCPNCYSEVTISKKKAQ